MERRTSVTVMVVLCYLGMLAVVVLDALALAGVGELRTGPSRFSPAQVVDLGTGDRVALWLGLQPLVLVLLAAGAIFIQVGNAVLRGDPFRPPTLRALRQLGPILGVGGVVATIIFDLVASAILSRDGQVFSVSISLGWIFAGLLASTVGHIVAEGVRRSGLPPAPPGPGQYGPAPYGPGPAPLGPGPG